MLDRGNCALDRAAEATHRPPGPHPAPPGGERQGQTGRMHL